MPDKLREYLGVLPPDYAQSSDFNVYDWARLKTVNDMSGITNISPPPKYFLDGRTVSKQDVYYFLDLCQKEVKEIMGVQ